VTRDEWVAAFSAAAGVTPPTSDELDTLLELAGVAAHASERTAAPITCWLAAIGGLSPAAALSLASSLGA
jgi:Domain of unknown function (DUF6457)